MTSRRFFIFRGSVVLVGILVAGVSAQDSRYPLPAESPAFADAINRGRTLVTGIIAARHIPGFSVAVGVGGRVVWSEGFGLADAEQLVAVTPMTRFRLGSVSKVLTAAAVARLVEEGHLDLDVAIQRYVPGFPKKPWPITTRQLTSHTAGIRHYAGDFQGVLSSAPHFDSVSKGLTIFQDDPLLFEPGTSYSYSSHGWNLVSAVVEGASQTEFLTYMQREIFEPLNLRNIAADHVDAIIPHRTRFYRRRKDGTLLNVAYQDNSYKWASGGLLSNAEDLVRFGSAHLQPGFFTQRTLDLLFADQRLRSGKNTGVGIAWRIGRDPKGRRVLHHGGSIDGGRAMLTMFPDSKVVVAMLANLYTDFGEREAQELGALFMP
jgi:CubicO group peptidase (beta-lactamase class C family)